MRINQIEDKKVNVTLNSDELVILINTLYFYEQHYKKDPDNPKKLNSTFHDLSAQLITASNLCQYGHLDDFALKCVLKHNVAAYPNSRLARSLNTAL